MTGEPLDAIEALLPAFALNALDEEDRALVEGALAQEPRYRAQLAEYLGTVSQLAVLHPAAVPSSALRERVLASRPPITSTVPEVFTREPASQAQRRKFQRGWLDAGRWAAAAALVLAVIGLGSFSAMQQRQVQDLMAQVDTLTASVEETEHRLLAQQALVYWVAQPGVETVTLRSTSFPPPLVGFSPRQEPRALLMRSPEGESVLVAINLAPLSEHLSYQAWAWNAQGRSISLGIFEVDEYGYAQIMVDYPHDVGEIYVISVSVEPAGGSARPSQQNVLIGLTDIQPATPGG